MSLRVLSFVMTRLLEPRDLPLLRGSGFLDPEWYLRTYPDVAARGMDPAIHYIRYGSREGRSPGPAFDIADYLARYPDVAASGMDPIVHYQRHGRKDERWFRREPMAPGETGEARPHMADEQIHWLARQMDLCAGYVEYGSGGSTSLAAATVRGFVLSVESSTEWMERVSRDQRVQARRKDCSLILHHADIGPTTDWGFPLDEPTPRMGFAYAFDSILRLESPQRSLADLVLVDGRFRVACALSSMLLLSRRGLVMLDDYEDRPYYRAIEDVASEPQMVGRAAVFSIEDADLPGCVALLSLFLGDPR